MNDYISHHGIEGQKWGVRNGPPYPLESGSSSKSYQKALRKNQQQITNRRDDTNRAYVKAAHYYEKAERAENKGNTERAEKFQSKMKDQIREFEKAHEDVERGRDIADSIIKQAKADGLTVSSKFFMQQAYPGKDIASRLITGTASVGVMAALTGGSGIAGTGLILGVMGSQYGTYDSSKYKVGTKAPKGKNWVQHDITGGKQNELLRFLEILRRR